MDTIVVWVIIAAAAFLVARRYIGIFKGKGGCCGDGAPCRSGDCPSGQAARGFPRPRGGDNRDTDRV